MPWTSLVSAHFRDAAREMECDEDEARFEETVKRVAKTPKAGPKPED